MSNKHDPLRLISQKQVLRVGKNGNRTYVSHVYLEEEQEFRVPFLYMFNPGSVVLHRIGTFFGHETKGDNYVRMVTKAVLRSGYLSDCIQLRNTEIVFLDGIPYAPIHLVPYNPLSLPHMIVQFDLVLV